MRVLITGISGFLGSHLARELTKQGRYDLVGVSRRPVEPLAGVEQVSGVDVKSDTDWSTLLQGVDVVIHCAARAHFPKAVSEQDILDTGAVNVGGTIRLASQAADAGVKRFIFISSIGVLGDSTAKPFDGTEEPAPGSVYAESKLKAERGVVSVCEKNDLEFVIIRPPMVYGPEAPGNFARLVRFSSLPLPLGRACRPRSFVSIWNLVDLIIACIDHVGASNEVLLVKDGQDVTTKEFLEAIARAKGARCYLPGVPAGVMRLMLTALGKGNIWRSLFASLQIDDSRTRKLLGWKPPLSLEESMERCFGFEQKESQ